MRLLPPAHAYTKHTLRDAAGQEMGCWMHSPATAGRAIYDWAVDVLDFHGYAEDELDWCEADEATPHDHGRLIATGEVVAVLHREDIPATELLATHQRAAKWLEAA